MACFSVWTVGILLVGLPLLSQTDDRRLAVWQFYGQIGICIPLPVTLSDFPCHSYAFGVMVVGSFVLFVMIAAGQLFIYWSIHVNAMSSDQTTRQSHDLTVARRLLTVAMSDFLCWFPIRLLGLLASSGTPNSLLGLLASSGTPIGLLGLLASSGTPIGLLTSNGTPIGLLTSNGTPIGLLGLLASSGTPIGLLTSNGTPIGLLGLLASSGTPIGLLGLLASSGTPIGLLGLLASSGTPIGLLGLLASSGTPIGLLGLLASSGTPIGLLGLLASSGTPIGLLGLLASSGTPIPGEVSVAMATFVLPFNSALSPFLYTLNVALEKRRRLEAERIEKRLLAQLWRRNADAKTT